MQNSPSFQLLSRDILVIKIAATKIWWLDTALQTEALLLQVVDALVAQGTACPQDFTAGEKHGRTQPIHSTSAQKLL